MTDLPDPVGVYRVEPGTLIVLQGTDFSASELDQMIETIEGIAGHRDFVLLVVPPGTGSAVYDPEQTRAALLGVVRELLDEKPTGFTTGATLDRPDR